MASNSKNHGCLRLFMILCVAAVIFNALFVHYTFTYSDALDQLSEALRQADGKKACEAMFSPSMLKKFDDDFYSDFSASIELTNSIIGFIVTDNVVWNFNEISKEELSEGFTKSIASNYSRYFDKKVRIKKAYNLEVEITWGNRTVTDELIVLCFSDCGWRVAVGSLNEMGLWIFPDEL